MSLKSLLSGWLSRSKKVSAPNSAPVAVFDPWPTLQGGLAAKLDRARSIDIAGITAEAASSPGTVERLAGYPSLWLEFGAIVENSVNVTLSDALELGSKILDTAGTDSDLWRWYTAYMRSPVGRGPVQIDDFLDLSRHLKPTFDAAIGTIRYVQQQLDTFTTFRDYRTVMNCIPSACWHANNTFEAGAAAEFDKRKNQLLNDAYAACDSLTQRVAFFHSLPPENHEDRGYWVCACAMRSKVLFAICDEVSDQIKTAQTQAELALVTIPQHLWTSSIDFTSRLTEDWKKKDRELKDKAEADRVRALLNSDGN